MLLVALFEILGDAAISVVRFEQVAAALLQERIGEREALAAAGLGRRRADLLGALPSVVGELVARGPNAGIVGKPAHRFAQADGPFVRFADVKEDVAERIE